MVIAQITDIHISPDLKPVHEVDVKANFRRILSDIKKEESVTHIVLTGDLCFNDPLSSTMEWVRNELNSTGIPYFVIPGNHDDSVLMAQVFDLEYCLQGNELYYNEIIDGVNLIFLDSAKGSLSVDQEAWLKAVDAVIPGPSIIFMHHPPVDAVPYMDKNYGLDEKESVMELLSAMRKPIAVFCGHYHVSKDIIGEGLLPVFITPSTFFQIDDQQEEFKVATKNIGWRMITMENELLKTEVNWLNPVS